MRRRRELAWRQVRDGWLPLCPTCERWYLSELFDQAVSAVYEADRGMSWDAIAKRGIENFHRRNHPQWLRMD